MKHRPFLYLFLTALLSGCHANGADSSEEMFVLGSALTKLSAAAESTVRYKAPPPALTDRELLVFATRHNPNLLAPFDDYTLLVLREDRHAVVLVCTKDGQKALMEDAGCSAELDARHWESSRTCGFTVKPAVVCVSSP